MEEIPMLFPVNPKEFWKQIKLLMEEVVEQKLTAAGEKKSPRSQLPEKTLLKATEVCAIFQVSNPPLRMDQTRAFKEF